VLQNLGKGVPITSKHFVPLQKIRMLVYQQEFQERWQLATALPRRPGMPQNRNAVPAMKKTHTSDPRLDTLQSGLWKAEQELLLKKQFEQLQRDQPKMQEMLPDVLRQLAQEDASSIAKKLRDSDPFNRWLAIHVAAKKWMPLEKDLIELLNDPYPGIRDAARNALMRLSRGNDFGPPVNATAVQIERAQAQWERWLALQFRNQNADTRSD
jgi:hypothetical protein